MNKSFKLWLQAHGADIVAGVLVIGGLLLMVFVVTYGAVDMILRVPHAWAKTLGVMVLLLELIAGVSLTLKRWE